MGETTMNLTKPQKLIYDMEKFTGGAISIVCGSMLISTDKSVDEMKKAVNELYRLNDALRIRVAEKDGQPYQYITEYQEQNIEVLSFNSKEDLDDYASKFAKEPLDFYGSLCDIKIVVLPDKKGVLAKLHHFISDAWTLSLIGTQFNKILNGEDVQVYSYADYVTAEEKYIESKRYTKDKDYFISQFKKCDEVTYISEKQAHTFEAKRATFVINKEDTSKILAYTKEKEVSVFSLFMSAAATYINRTKMNADKIYVGTPVLNRSNVEEKNTVGMFINTVPVLIQLNNNSSFLENLINVEDDNISVFRHQKFNYGDLLAELRYNHNFNAKLYDIMLSFQNATVLGDEVETTWYHSGMQTESLQIHIDDRDSEGIFRVHYDYLAEKFTEHEIEKMHEHICNLLFSAIEDDSKKLYELNILSTEERQTLMFDFNDTAFDYPKDKCVHRLFEEQVEKNPDKVAVVACDKTLTYKELNEEANRIAHSLIEKGIGRGDIVAVILPRDSHLIPALFGVLKTGAAYMPLDPSYPKDRIDYLITESDSTSVIDESNIEDYISNTNTENPDIKVLHSDLFCALHTSGSTGRPKVTALTQQNLLNFLYSNKDFWKDVETVICVTIATFDIFMQDTLLSASLGKKVILASNEQIYNQPEFEKMFANEENVMFFSTPTKLMSYIKQSKTADFFKKIRSLIVGGEVFTDELYDLIIEKVGTETLRNGYGPTETTIGTSYIDPVPSQNSAIELSPTFTDQQKQQSGAHKQTVVYNGYGPTETTLGTVFSAEVLPPRFSIQEKCLTATDRVKQQLCAQDYLQIINVYGPAETALFVSKKALKIFNVYGPAEAYIVSTETATIER